MGRSTPDDLSCLSSLQDLDLSRNNFTHLPDSISQLSKLKRLTLNDCSRFQSLPVLPLSIGFLSIKRCPLLWKIMQINLLHGLRVKQDSLLLIVIAVMMPIASFRFHHTSTSSHSLKDLWRLLTFYLTHTSKHTTQTHVR